MTSRKSNELIVIGSIGVFGVIYNRLYLNELILMIIVNNLCSVRQVNQH